MVIFFDQQIQSIYPGTQNADLAWHKIHCLLAVSGSSTAAGQTVAVYKEDGECIPKSLQRKSVAASVLQWHPIRKILATGWLSGEISIYNSQDNEIFDSPRVHKSEITVMQWSSNGTQIITSDKTGQVYVWKVDIKGRFQGQPILQQTVNDSLNTVVLIPPPPVNAQDSDIHKLARAAVSGDQLALDMFSWDKAKSSQKFSTQSYENIEGLSYFVGGKKGGVFYVGEGNISQKFTVEGSVKKLLYQDEKNQLITISSNMILNIHVVASNRETAQTVQVKLSGKADTSDVIWVGKSILATCTSESIIRLWDIEKDENYVLSTSGSQYADDQDIISSISYSPFKNVLSAGTSRGKIYQWVQNEDSKSVELAESWQLQPPLTIVGCIIDIMFGSNKSLLAVNTMDNVFIVTEQQPSFAAFQGTAVVQTGTMDLQIDIYPLNKHHNLKTDIQVKGLSCSKEYLTLTNGIKIVVYELGEEGMVRPVGNFNCQHRIISMYEQNIYTIEPANIQVRNFQGTVKQLLPLPDSADVVVSMEICSEYIIVATASNAIKIFDLSRREAKSHTGPKYFHSLIEGKFKIFSAKCNSNATKVSIIIEKNDGTIDSKIFVWDIESNQIQFFNFLTGRDENDEFFPEAGEDSSLADRKTSKRKGKSLNAKDISGRYPLSHFWDHEETKLLVCEAKLFKINKIEDKNNKKVYDINTLPKESNDTMVVSLFCTAENGILIQDSFPNDDLYHKLISVEIPFYCFSKNHSSVKASNESINAKSDEKRSAFGTIRRTHRDFAGLETADRDAREAMMNFSFYLTLGNMDEAFKAIKLIKSESVWENMAKMCVKTRRLDVARVCLGKMGCAREARLLRQTIEKEPELDAQIASLAFQLGLYEDAERLLKNCGRNDLLNKLYQNIGDWDKAIAVAELQDRIHLKSTYYNYAKYLEENGREIEAIKYYEKSGSNAFEVPRLLRDNLIALETYVNKSKDNELLKWWALNSESSGNIETAMKYYEMAGDHLSLVRMYCLNGQVDKAIEVCNSSKDKTACYHMARHYENTENIEEAIAYYVRADSYGNSIRLCKEHGMDDKLINMAVRGRKDEMLEAAKYYESNGENLDKAVVLYHKAGYSSKAIELAFSSKQYSALQTISESLDENSDPQHLQRCAQFFIENSQFDRAVDLLAAAKRYSDALRICHEQHVPMTEELVEKLSPGSSTEASERNSILEAIGDICINQRQYHLATKKYTQASNRIKAMKALLKSGDSEKIIFFANVSRQRDIYIMAGHYLQTLDWQKDPEIIKNIINFYTKGKAPDALAGFYDACAQAEIDEYQNYEKALGALEEAYKCLTKTQTDNNLPDSKLNDLKERMAVMHKFVKAKSIYSQNSEEAMKICQSLLTDPNCEKGVRIGDIYGMMTEHFAKIEKWKTAYSCIEEMRKHVGRADLAKYISPRSLESIHKALKIVYVADQRMSYNGMNKSTAEANEEEEDGEMLNEDVED